MNPEPLKKNHVFAVNLEGDGVASDFPKDEEGYDACTSDEWIRAVDIKKVKAAVKWLKQSVESIKFNDSKSKDYDVALSNFIYFVDKAFTDVTSHYPLDTDTSES